ncbi:MAG: hypothetical protein QW569_04985 [Candidatus Bathyarchaeia archaeon]
MEGSADTPLRGYRHPSGIHPWGYKGSNLKFYGPEILLRYTGYAAD